MSNWRNKLNWDTQLPVENLQPAAMKKYFETLGLTVVWNAVNRNSRTYVVAKRTEDSRGWEELVFDYKDLTNRIKVDYPTAEFEYEKEFRLPDNRKKDIIRIRLPLSRSTKVMAEEEMEEYLESKEVYFDNFYQINKNSFMIIGRSDWLDLEELKQIAAAIGYRIVRDTSPSMRARELTRNRNNIVRFRIIRAINEGLRLDWATNLPQDEYSFEELPTVLGPNQIWECSFPEGYNETNIAKYFHTGNYYEFDKIKFSEIRGRMQPVLVCDYAGWADDTEPKSGYSAGRTISKDRAPFKLISGEIKTSSLKLDWAIPEPVPTLTENDNAGEHIGDPVIFLIYHNRRDEKEGWDIYGADIHNTHGSIENPKLHFDTLNYEYAREYAEDYVRWWNKRYTQKEYKKDYRPFWYMVSENEKEYLERSKKLQWQEPTLKIGEEVFDNTSGEILGNIKSFEGSEYVLISIPPEFKYLLEVFPSGIMKRDIKEVDSNETYDWKYPNIGSNASLKLDWANVPEEYPLEELLKAIGPNQIWISQDDRYLHTGTTTTAKMVNSGKRYDGNIRVTDARWSLLPGITAMPSKICYIPPIRTPMKLVSGTPRTSSLKPGDKVRIKTDMFRMDFKDSFGYDSKNLKDQAFEVAAVSEENNTIKLKSGDVVVNEKLNNEDKTFTKVAWMLSPGMKSLNDDSELIEYLKQSFGKAAFVVSVKSDSFVSSKYDFVISLYSYNEASGHLSYEKDITNLPFPSFEEAEQYALATVEKQDLPFYKGFAYQEAKKVSEAQNYQWQILVTNNAEDYVGWLVEAKPIERRKFLKGRYYGVIVKVKDELIYAIWERSSTAAKYNYLQAPPRFLSINGNSSELTTFHIDEITIEPIEELKSKKDSTARRPGFGLDWANIPEEFKTGEEVAFLTNFQGKDYTAIGYIMHFNQDRSAALVNAHIELRDAMYHFDEYVSLDKLHRFPPTKPYVDASLKLNWQEHPDFTYTVEYSHGITGQQWFESSNYFEILNRLIALEKEHKLSDVILITRSNNIFSEEIIYQGNGRGTWNFKYLTPEERKFTKENLKDSMIDPADALVKNDNDGSYNLGWSTELLDYENVVLEEIEDYLVNRVWVEYSLDRDAKVISILSGRDIENDEDFKHVIEGAKEIGYTIKEYNGKVHTSLKLDWVYPSQERFNEFDIYDNQLYVIDEEGALVYNVQAQTEVRANGASFDGNKEVEIRVEFLGVKEDNPNHKPYFEEGGNKYLYIPIDDFYKYFMLVETSLKLDWAVPEPVPTIETWGEHRGDRVVFLIGIDKKLFESERGSWSCWTATISDRGAAEGPERFYETEDYRVAREHAESFVRDWNSQYGIKEEHKKDLTTKCWYYQSIDEDTYLSEQEGGLQWRYPPKEQYENLALNRENKYRINDEGARIYKVPSQSLAIAPGKSFTPGTGHIAIRVEFLDVKEDDPNHILGFTDDDNKWMYVPLDDFYEYFTKVDEGLKLDWNMDIDGYQGIYFSSTEEGFRYEVMKNGEVLDPKLSLFIMNHSPGGFAWGYGGSGPAQLALALLLDATGDSDLARRAHQEFKDDVVAKFPSQGNWSLTKEEILNWVRDNYVNTGMRWLSKEEDRREREEQEQPPEDNNHAEPFDDDFLWNTIPYTYELVLRKSYPAHSNFVPEKRSDLTFEEAVDIVNLSPTEIANANYYSVMNINRINHDLEADFPTQMIYASYINRSANLEEGYWYHLTEEESKLVETKITVPNRKNISAT